MSDGIRETPARTEQRGDAAMNKAREWSFYFPEDGETASDAVPIIGSVFDAEDAAAEACRYDYGSRDGWERIESEFPIVVISPDGEETHFLGCHERTIQHTVREARP